MCWSKIILKIKILSASVERKIKRVLKYLLTIITVECVITILGFKFGKDWACMMIIVVQKDVRKIFEYKIKYIKN